MSVSLNSAAPTAAIQNPTVVATDTSAEPIGTDRAPAVLLEEVDDFLIVHNLIHTIRKFPEWARTANLPTAKHVLGGQTLTTKRFVVYIDRECFLCDVRSGFQGRDNQTVTDKEQLYGSPLLLPPPESGNEETTADERSENSDGHLLDVQPVAANQKEHEHRLKLRERYGVIEVSGDAWKRLWNQFLRDLPRQMFMINGASPPGILCEVTPRQSLEHQVIKKIEAFVQHYANEEVLKYMKANNHTSHDDSSWFSSLLGFFTRTEEKSHQTGSPLHKSQRESTLPPSKVESVESVPAATSHTQICGASEGLEELCVDKDTEDEEHEALKRILTMDTVRLIILLCQQSVLALPMEFLNAQFCSEADSELHVGEIKCDDAEELKRMGITSTSMTINLTDAANAEPLQSESVVSDSVIGALDSNESFPFFSFGSIPERSIFQLHDNDSYTIFDDSATTAAAAAAATKNTQPSEAKSASPITPSLLRRGPPRVEVMKPVRLFTLTPQGNAYTLFFLTLRLSVPLLQLVDHVELEWCIIPAPKPVSRAAALTEDSQPIRDRHCSCLGASSGFHKETCVLNTMRTAE